MVGISPPKLAFIAPPSLGDILCGNLSNNLCHAEATLSVRRFKNLFFCTASLVERTRLAVQKQSFLNLLRQNGLRVTKVFA